MGTERVGKGCGDEHPRTGRRRWLGLLWAASRMHPDLFREVDLPSEVIRFYSHFGMDEATIRAEVFPLIRENIGQKPDEN